MFKDVSKFQIIFIGVFVFFAVGGVLGFALFKGSKSKTVPITVVWGTVDSTLVKPYIDQVAFKSGNTIRVTYIEKSPETFDNALLEALATGKGPDAILVSQESLLRQSNKIYPIPYANLSDRDFKSTFVQEAELFLSNQGVLAIPFAIDPMVMYWNRDIFTNASISLPPKYWEEFLTLVPALTKKDSSQGFIQSAVAMGEYRNINHAKNILTLLMLQAGNPIIVSTSAGYKPTLTSTFSNNLPSASAALSFYTGFADPLKPLYTWNRGISLNQNTVDAKTFFLANKLAIYFGFASEYNELKSKNPNLNIDVTYMPQSQPQANTQNVDTTFGNMYGFALLRSSKDIKSSYTAVSYLTSQQNAAIWSQLSGLPSVRRDSLNYDPSNAASAVFNTSALRAKGWLDPDASGSETIFKDMIEGITSGRTLLSEAITNANERLNVLTDTVNKNNGF